MLMDRRRAQRHTVADPGRIHCRIGDPPRDCVISDISDGGVRLVAYDVGVPEQFILTFVAVGRRRECRVVWRFASEIGAEFVDEAEDDFVDRILQAT
jgi:PilZ domain